MLAIISRIVPAAFAQSDDAAQVEAVVGDRQSVAARRREQVRRRHAEVAEDDAAVVRVLERPQAVLAELKVVRSLRAASSTISTAGLSSIRHTSPIVRPGTTLVMNSFSPLTT